MSQTDEAITIIMVGRDRFSQTEDCIENLKAHTPEPHRLIVVLGGAPAELENQLRERYAETVTFVFERRFLNCSEARNIALRLATTRLSVCMDNDIFPRPGWLPPLLRCQKETSAGLVVPLILEDDTHIHCAGNDLFVTKKGGRTFVRKVLPYGSQPVYEGTNIKRREIDYGEMHLQLVDTKAALELGVHDDRIQEGQELDSGLTWRKAGRSVWFEPESIVVYDLPSCVEHPEDIAFFGWRWNAANLIPGYKVMHEKWDMDMTEDGYFKYFIRAFNKKLGWLPRLWHSPTALKIDRAMGRAFALFTETPDKVRTLLYGWGTGHNKWVAELEGGKPASHRVAAKILKMLGKGPDRDAERLEVQDGIYLEVVRLQDGEVRGPGASLFAKGEEVLRLVCLGNGRGHYQVYPNRRKRWEIPRHYFKEETVAAQIDAAVRLVERESQERLRASPVPALRDVALDPGRLAQACRGLSEKLSARIH